MWTLFKANDLKVIFNVILSDINYFNPLGPFAYVKDITMHVVVPRGHAFIDSMFILKRTLQNLKRQIFIY